MEQPNVSELQKDARFEGWLLVRSGDQRTSSNGSKYLDMNLTDRTGEINAKMWDGTVLPPMAGTVIKVRGTVQEYNGRMQLRIEKFRQAQMSQDEVDITRLTPCAPEKPETMFGELSETVNGMTSEPLKKLVGEMLTMAGEKLMYYPAGQRLHHAERSGLLHHTTGMLHTANAILQVYPFLNADLLRAGVIAHDLCKITEMKSDELGVVSDYSRDGLLIGHLVRGVTMVREAARRAGVTGETVLLMEHMVISHHGEAEFGSPRMPMFPEAEALHWVDLLDARMNEMQGILDRTPVGSFSEKIWSLDRRMYHPDYDRLSDPVADKPLDDFEPFK